jgi:hypothetical protein
MSESDDPAATLAVVAWQGWRLRVPVSWGPVKLEGDYAAGTATFADMERKRLEMRWTTHRHGTDVHDMMRKEVGELAAREAEQFSLHSWATSLLFLEPEPPGRDVWVGNGPASDRLLTITSNCQRRDRVLAEQVLPSVQEQAIDAPWLWSIFGLRCIVPATFRLQGHRLNAGDLNLSFAREKERIGVRQVAVASLALRHKPLERWVAQHQRKRNEFKILTEPREVSVDLRNHSARGLLATAHRRRRYMLLRSLPAVVVTLAVHDVERDRLILVEAGSEESARQVATTVGCAAMEAPQPCRC